MMGVNFVVQGYGVYQFSALPCRQRSAGAVILGCQLAIMVEDVTAVIIFLTPGHTPFFVMLIIGLVGWAVASIGCHFWMGWKFNSIVKKLHALVEEGIESDEVTELLRAYGLVRSRRTLNTYLNVALESGAQALLNGSIPRHIMNNQNECPDEPVDMLAALLRVLILLPHEGRRTGPLLRQVERKRGSPYSTRFLVWQCERIRVVRNCSNSALANNALHVMKALSTSVIQMQKSLWSQVTVPWPALRRLNDAIESARGELCDLTVNFPSSVQHAEVLLEFLCEGATDFTRGIAQRNRIDLLEAGQNFAVDNCFRSLVRVYPVYLKKGLLTMKGELARGAGGGGGGGGASKSSSQSGAGASSSSGGSSEGGLDLELEAQIGQDLLRGFRPRLAAQAALEERSLGASTPLLILTMWCLVVPVVVALVLYFVFRDIFAHVEAESTEMGALIDGFWHITTMVLESTIWLGEVTGMVDDSRPTQVSTTTRNRWRSAQSRASTCGKRHLIW
jgi:uncharacterized membrane protein YgcG